MNFMEAYKKFGRTAEDDVVIQKDDEDTLYDVAETEDVSQKNADDVSKIDLNSLSDEDVSRIATALFNLQNTSSGDSTTKEGE